jgi:hypothetical protein
MQTSIRPALHTRTVVYLTVALFENSLYICFSDVSFHVHTSDEFQTVEKTIHAYTHIHAYKHIVTFYGVLDHF